MVWPTNNDNNALMTTHFDEGADNPSLARPVLLKVIQVLKSIIGARGVANGVASTDASNKLAQNILAAKIEGNITNTLQPGNGASIPKITVSTSAPSSTAGIDGEIWLQREA